MSSYTVQQYAEQVRVAVIVGAANALQQCPVCHQPQGVWRDGTKRITCGRTECYRKWLNIRQTKEQGSGT
jgi:hypothetical protein